MSYVYDSTLLTASKIYQYEGCLYRFSYQSGGVRAPQFHFEPLAGQVRKADIELNQRQLRRVQETTLKAGAVHQNYIQLSLL